MTKTAWKRQNSIGNFPAKKIPRFLSYHRGPECPPGDLKIINSSLQSTGVKRNWFYKMNHNDKGHMKL